ncbi:GreA/GreB family elongation factor [Candidatus Dojkabacteria bacterium]|nr:GreA/GreB family elongation factor [Candidatus Dojkabacteria bacterium]
MVAGPDTAQAHQNEALVHLVVQHGDVVTFQGHDEDGTFNETVAILHEHETPLLGVDSISPDSPVAKAIIGQQKGATVTVRAPVPYEIKILDITSN